MFNLEDLTGKEKVKAIDYIQRSGYTYRIRSEDGSYYGLTDHKDTEEKNEHRVNLDIELGVVVFAEIY